MFQTPVLYNIVSWLQNLTGSFNALLSLQNIEKKLTKTNSNGNNSSNLNNVNNTNNGNSTNESAMNEIKKQNEGFKLWRNCVKREKVSVNKLSNSLKNGVETWNKGELYVFQDGIMILKSEHTTQQEQQQEQQQQQQQPMKESSSSSLIEGKMNEMLVWRWRDGLKFVRLQSEQDNDMLILHYHGKNELRLKISKR